MSINEAIHTDNSALIAWLGRHVGDFGKVEAIDKFSGGQSNPTYLISAANGKYVLRAKPPGKLLKSAHQVNREYRVMKALADTQVPVPRVCALCDDEQSPVGRMFFLMEHLDGQIFWNPALPDFTDNHGQAKERRTQLYDRMNQTLAHLHDVDIEAVGLGDFGRQGNYFARQLSIWAKQYRQSQTERYDDLDHLIKWLETQMPEDDGLVGLVHGDYRLDNLMFSRDDDKILGVLDWELSTLGHPLADLAYQCMQWRLPNQGRFRGLGGVDRAALGLPSEEDYVARYCQRRNIGEIENWHFYLAFSFFRIAAILQGVYKRFLDGNASNPDIARDYGKTVPLLGQMAMDVIKER